MFRVFCPKSTVNTKEPIEARSSRASARPSWARDSRSSSYGLIRRQSSIVGNVLEYAFIRLIFLDIDGSINHPNDLERSSTVVCPDCAKCLKDIIEQTSSNIVLSSSWRLNPQFRRALFTHLRALEVRKGVIIGETRDLSSQKKNRADEIRDWLLNPNLYKEGDSALQPWQIQSWMSLDDMDLKGMELEEELRSHHFTIDPSLGLCKTKSIVTKVVEKLRVGWNATYYQDKWKVVPKRRTKISRELSLTHLKKIEDLFPCPDTIHEDETSDGVFVTNITFSEEVSGSEINYTDSSQAQGDVCNVHATQSGFTANKENRSSVRILSTGLPYSKSHTDTNSCRIIFQGRANGIKRVLYRPSVLKNAQAKTNREYHLPEEYQPQDTLKSRSKRHSSNISFSLANLTNCTSGIGGLEEK